MAPKNNPSTMHDNESYSPPPPQQHHYSSFHERSNGSSSQSSTRANTSDGERSGGGSLPRGGRGKDPEGRSVGSNPSFDGRHPAHEAHLLQSSARSARSGARQHSSAAARGRRRPTNYTSSYTPPSELVEIAAKGREAQNAKAGRSRTKCSSLDRSEDEGDERRRHLRNGGGGLSRGESGGSGGNDVGRGELVGDNDYQRQQEHIKQQQRLSYEQGQLQRMQRMLHQQEQLEQKRKQEQKQRQSIHEQQQYNAQNQQPDQQGSSRDRRKQRGGDGSNRSSGVSHRSSRRSSQEHGASPTPSSSRKQGGGRRASQEHGGGSPRGGQSRGDRKGHGSSSRRGSHHEPRTSRDEELAEQQRIEEYAGKRAMLRLEQELADHSESQQSSMNHENGEAFKSVMDRRKLARVPQVKKSDLIIGEYLGRGNFCDVFEVTWILPEQRGGSGGGGTRGGGLIQGWSSNRTLNTYSTNSTDEGSDLDSQGMEASMEDLALSCSNDLSLIGGRNLGMVKSASRRSISQVRTSTGGGGDRRGGRSLAENFGRSTLRNPNVLALKCLRPAVRAQPRKFVIGAEDLAHETALLACLDHPNIIQLYGRAEGCFSTAFQMRSKDSSGGGSHTQEGKRMSDEGYFIILDRLMTTLTDRIDEWRSECRAINGLAPPDGTPIPMPPESTLREHLCKRLKVAYCIADALEYLHSRNCVFRDLKPANVGFDCNDCVKMFDFGFATSIAPLLSQPYDGYGPLTETCGTRRYMAPEVALKLGYGKEVDVYSFGMLLWEICALDKPFDAIQSVDEFHDLVVLCGRRPSLNADPLWTSSLKNLMCRCWSTDPLDRPTMCEVKTLLCNVLRDMNRAMETSRQSRGAREGGARNSGGGGGGRRANAAQRQEQGGNFIHKWRRRVSI